MFLNAENRGGGAARQPPRSSKIRRAFWRKVVSSLGAISTIICSLGDRARRVRKTLVTMSVRCGPPRFPRDQQPSTMIWAKYSKLITAGCRCNCRRVRDTRTHFAAREAARQSVAAIGYADSPRKSCRLEGHLAATHVARMFEAWNCRSTSHAWWRVLTARHESAVSAESFSAPGAPCPARDPEGDSLRLGRGTAGCTAWPGNRRTPVAALVSDLSLRDESGPGGRRPARGIAMRWNRLRRFLVRFVLSGGCLRATLENRPCIRIGVQSASKVRSSRTGRRPTGPTAAAHRSERQLAVRIAP